MRGKKRAAVAAVIVVVGTAVAMLWATRHASPHATSRSAPSTTVGAPRLSSMQASQLAAELSAGTDASLRQAIVIPPGQALDPAAAAGLRGLGAIHLDVATFRSIDATDATVRGSVTRPPAGEPEDWQFTLSRIGGRWKLLDAQPLR